MAIVMKKANEGAGARPDYEIVEELKQSLKTASLQEKIDKVEQLHTGGWDFSMKGNKKNIAVCKEWVSYSYDNNKIDELRWLVNEALKLKEREDSKPAVRALEAMPTYTQKEKWVLHCASSFHSLYYERNNKEVRKQLFIFYKEVGAQ